MAGSSNFLEEFLVGVGFKFEGDDGERFKKQTEVIASTINKVTMAAVAATAALFAMTKANADNNYELNQTAVMLDTSAQSLARWKHAADIAGVGGENVVNMLTHLKQQAQEAARTGSGPFRAYQELGVDFEKLADGGIDVADALDLIIQNAQKMDRETAKGALRELGIDEKFLDTPVEKLHQAMADADKWGQTTDELIGLSKKFAESQADVSLKLGGVVNMISVRVLPVLIEFFDKLEEGLEWLQTTGFPIMDKFAEKIGGWDKVLMALGGVALVGTIAGLSKILTLVTGIAGGAAGAGSALALLFKAGMVGAAGYAGWEAGTAINDALPQDVQDAIGEYLTKSLAFVGVKGAKDAVEATEGKPFEGFWEVLERNRRDAAEKFYSANPGQRPTTGKDSKPTATLDDWLAAPADPNGGWPDMPAATADGAEGDSAIPNLVNEADLHKIVPPREGGAAGGAPTTIDNRKTITNHFNGVPLQEVEEIYNKSEQRENLYLENENTSPVVR